MKCKEESSSLLRVKGSRSVEIKALGYQINKG